MSATSRHPLSITSECPRPAISWNSVTAALRFWRWNAAFVMAQGTVLSRSPERILSGPRSGLNPEPAHPVRRAVLEHRAWFLGAVRHLLDLAGHPDARHAARALVTLRDGAMMGGYLDGADPVVDGLAWAARLIADART